MNTCLFNSICWEFCRGSKRLYRKGSHLYPQFPKISLNFPWISKEAAQKKEMHGNRKIKEIRGNLRKYHVITYNFRFPFFLMNIYMPCWSQALQGVNKKCSAAVNILHFECPLRVTEIPCSRQLWRWGKCLTNTLIKRATSCKPAGFTLTMGHQPAFLTSSCVAGA